MNEHSLQENNDSGYFFPFVIFISLILFSAVTASITIYQNELMISEQLFEQMKAESIVQMSIQQFTKERPYNENQSGEITYLFPSGTVSLNYELMDENLYLIMLDIETDKKKSFLIKKLFQVNENNEKLID